MTDWVEFEHGLGRESERGVDWVGGKSRERRMHEREGR